MYFVFYVDVGNKLDISTTCLKLNYKFCLTCLHWVHISYLGKKRSLLIFFAVLRNLNFSKIVHH